MLSAATESTKRPSLSTVYPTVDLNRCPYPFYELLRKERPVYEIPCNSGRPEFLLVDYDDLLYVSHHPELFTNDVLGFTLPSGDVVAPQGNGQSVVLNPPGYGLQHDTNPPGRANPDRVLAFTPFKPSRLRAYEPLIARVADELIDGFIHQGEADFTADFARPLPVVTICDVLGLSRDARPRMLFWAAGLASGNVRFYSADQIAVQGRKNAELQEFLDAELCARRDHPRDDVLSELIQLQVERDGHFDLGLLRHIAAFLALGGAKTSAHMLASMMALLLEYPDQMTKLAATPLRMEGFVEESLRLEAPIQHVTRLARVDTELHGVKIPAGSILYLSTGASNRDPKKFVRATGFDVERQNAREQVAFGIGLHFCLGAPLARLEGRIGMSRLLARLTDIKLVVGKSDLSNIESPHFRGPRRIRIAFRPTDLI